MRVFGVVGSDVSAIPQKGYISGGTDTAFSTTYNSTDIFSFDTETYSAGSNTPVNRYSPTSVSNFDVAGYAISGNSISPIANIQTIDKVDFSNDSFSFISVGSGSDARGIAMSNSGTAGYAAGGGVSGGSSLLRKLTFSNESFGSLSTSFPTIGWGGGVSNHQVAGYTMGGWETSSNRVNKIHKLNFSSEAISTLNTTMSYAARGHSSSGTGIHNAGQAGYVGGGASSAGLVTTIDKLNFSNETRSTLSATLEIAKNHVVGLSKSGTAGYFVMGLDAVTLAYVNTGIKISFSNDTSSSVPTASPAQGRFGQSSVSNSV